MQVPTIAVRHPEKGVAIINAEDAESWQAQGWAVEGEKAPEPEGEKPPADKPPADKPAKKPKK